MLLKLRFAGSTDSEASPAQKVNAEIPMEVTLAGTVRLVRALQPENA